MVSSIILSFMIYFVTLSTATDDWDAKVCFVDWDDYDSSFNGIWFKPYHGESVIRYSGPNGLSLYKYYECSYCGSNGWYISLSCCDPHSGIGYTCSCGSEFLSQCNGKWYCADSRSKYSKLHLPNSYPKGKIFYDSCPETINPTMDSITIPSNDPSHIPSNDPSHIPSSDPSHIPSNHPSHIPSSDPSHIPSTEPSHIPITESSRFPTTQSSHFQILNQTTSSNKPIQTTSSNIPIQQHQIKYSSSTTSKSLSSPISASASSDFWNYNWLYFVIGISVMLCCSVGSCIIFLILYCKNRKRGKEVMNDEENLTSNYDVNQKNVELITLENNKKQSATFQYEKCLDERQ